LRPEENVVNAVGATSIAGFLQGLEKLDVVVAVGLIHRPKRQRVEQLVAPVLLPVVDVLELTQELPQCHRLDGVESEEFVGPVQHHHDDHAILALRYDVRIKCSVEVEHTTSTANTQLGTYTHVIYVIDSDAGQVVRPSINQSKLWIHTRKPVAL